MIITAPGFGPLYFGSKAHHALGELARIAIDADNWHAYREIRLAMFPIEHCYIPTARELAAQALCYQAATVRGLL